MLTLAIAGAVAGIWPALVLLILFAMFAKRAIASAQHGNY